MSDKRRSESEVQGSRVKRPRWDTNGTPDGPGPGSSQQAGLNGGSAAVPSAVPVAAAAPAAAGKAVSNGQPVVKTGLATQEALARAKKALEGKKEQLRALKEAKERAQAAKSAGLPAATQPSSAATAALPPQTAQQVFLAGLQTAAALSGGFSRPPGANLGVPQAPGKPAAGTFRPAPLRLDEQGREVDETGRPIEQKLEAVTTLKVNQKKQDNRRHEAQQEPAVDATRFVDPFLGDKGLRRLERGRRRGALQFVAEGKFQRQAENARLRATLGDRAVQQMRAEAKRKAAEKASAAEALDVNQIPLGQRVPEPAPEPEAAPEPIPDVEWWDARILKDPSTYFPEHKTDGHEGRDTQEGASAMDLATSSGTGGDQAAQGSGSHAGEPHGAARNAADGNDGAGSGADGSGGAAAMEEDTSGNGDRTADGDGNAGAGGAGARAAAGQGEAAVVRPLAGLENVLVDKITGYVEHPVLIQPPVPEPEPQPLPLMLTKKEMKKMRTQRRQEREKERQDLIRQGLLEAPPPKVKLSNLMRVLGEEATADPTAIEAEVRKQMNERQQAHEDRNLSRKLTPAERNDKKLRKLLGEADGTAAPQVAVYRVRDLSAPQLKFKVEMNARELKMTGCVVISEGLTVVLVEGGPKQHKHYSKLMLRRIDWNAYRDEEEEAGEEEGQPERPPNECQLVWEGTTKERAFDTLVVEQCRTEAAARKFFADRNLGHFFDLAAKGKEEEP